MTTFETLSNTGPDRRTEDARARAAARRFEAHPLREQAQKLLREGTEPRQVVSTLGLHWRLVRQWAIDVGRPPEDQRAPARARREKAEELLRAGRRPKDVAQSSGASLSAVRGWARTIGLPPLVGRRPAHPGRARAEELLREGKPVKDVAADVGALVDTVYHWKRQLDWADAQAADGADGRPRHPLRDSAEEMLRNGDSTRKVAAAVGIGRSTAWDWRRQLGLGKH